MASAPGGKAGQVELVGPPGVRGNGPRHRLLGSPVEPYKALLRFFELARWRLGYLLIVFQGSLLITRLIMQAFEVSTV